MAAKQTPRRAAGGQRSSAGSDSGTTVQPYASAARRYHAAGWSPLPLPPRRKKTPPGGWTGRGMPMASAADVEAWCEDRAAGNIALRLPPGVIGIDVDAHKGAAEAEDWRNLLGKLGPLPESAPWCSSRDDGLSGIRLCRIPDGYVAADMGPAGEVIQHHHRYIVAPPSIHPDTGQPYRWIGRPEGWIPSVKYLPPLPDAWLNRLRAGPVFQQPGQRTTWTHPDVNELVTGGIPADVNQDQHLRDLVFECVRNGMNYDATRAAWEATVTRTPLARPGEPWTAADFQRHYRGALRKAPGSPAAEHDGGPGQEQPPSRLDQLRAALLDSDGLDNLPAPEPLIDGLLYRDSLAWLHGKPGHGKSLLALDQACCIAAGLPWMGRPVSGGPVLYVIAEGATGLRARVRAWEDRAGEKTRVKFLPVAVQMLQLGEAEAVAALAAEMGCVLAVIDTQARVSVGADENSSQDMGRLVEAADKIRTASGACVQLVHHEARAGDNMRGSTALEGAATTILRAVKDGSRLELTNPKQKDAAEADPVTLWVVPRLQSVVIAGKPDGPTLDLRADSENKILTALLDLFGTTGAAATTLREATGLSKSTFHWALNRLVKDGLIQNLGSRTRTCYALAQDALPAEVQQVQQGPSPTGPMSNGVTRGNAIGLGPLDHRPEDSQGAEAQAAP